MDCRRTTRQQQPLFVLPDDEDAESRTGDQDEMFGEDWDTGTVMLDDLSWRVEKMRLEEQNKKRFLKSSPRFLPYNECRRWVQAFGRREAEEDWRQWISMGEKRNSYIPSRPDEYYGKLGQWYVYLSGMGPRTAGKLATRDTAMGRGFTAQDSMSNTRALATEQTSFIMKPWYSHKTIDFLQGELGALLEDRSRRRRTQTKRWLKLPSY